MLSGMDRSIFIIRHGEKPPPGHGVDAGGKQDEHSLVPLGWQRAGALATLFAGKRAASRERTHQTITPLAALLGVEIESPYKPPGTAIPPSWPGKRFDVVWCFALDSDSGVYEFSQVPQMLLHGDRDTPIGT
ncbi:MAG: hypothetical protein QOC77_84 [Thermoleophilaceae bacterium]|jgi:hypothetical protein|nr:hypothetical protein [Thermoleophilaceae bacterium]